MIFGRLDGTVCYIKFFLQFLLSTASPNDTQYTTQYDAKETSGASENVDLNLFIDSVFFEKGEIVVG